jgi:hypothetical protein
MSAVVTGSGSEFDVFVSYDHADVASVRPLTAVLESAGLRVFVDSVSIEPHASISERITAAIASTKVMLAFYSRTYPDRPYCQEELKAAYLAAQRAGPATERILVINPEADDSHIEPVDLRDARWVCEPGHDVERQQIAARVAGAVARVDTPLGPAVSTAPRWWSPRSTDRRLFVGRHRELWRLHSALTVDRYPYGERPTSRRTVTVYGLGGVGKTELSMHYANAFADAYPGGTAYVSLAGGDPALSGATQAAPEKRLSTCFSTYRRQIRRVAQSAGIDLQEAPSDQVLDVVGSAVTDRGEYWLWIIDDVPEDLPVEAVWQMLIPSPYACVILNSRSGRFATLGVGMKLDGMSGPDSLALLAGCYPASERDAALELTADLGGHPLALTLAAASLRESRGLMTVNDYRRRIRAEPVDRRIGAAVAAAIDGLDDVATTVLAVAGVLAAAPIPVRLAAAAVATLHGLPAETATRHTGQALADLEQRCAIRRSDVDFEAHPVVLRTLPSKPDERIVDGVTRAFADLLEELSTSGQQQTVAAHAEHLTDARMPSDHAVQLLVWLAEAAQRTGEHRHAGDLGARLVSRLLQRGDPADDRIVHAACTAAAMYLDVEAFDLALPLARLATERIGSGAHTAANRATGEQVFARALDAVGRFDEADAHWSTAQVHRSALDDHLAACYYVENVRALRIRGRLADARRMLDDIPAADDLLPRLVEDAELRRARGEPVLAKRAAERAMEGYRQRGQRRHPGFLAATLVVLNAKLDIAARTPYLPFRRAHEQILAEMRNTRDEYAAQFGRESPLTLAVNISYGTALARWNDDQHGQDHGILLNAERAARRVLGMRHPQRLRALYGLSFVALLSQRLADAAENAREAYEGQRLVLGEWHPDTLCSQLQAGFTRRLLGEEEAGAGMILQASKRLTKVLGIKHEEVWRSWVSVAVLPVPVRMLRAAGALVSRVPLP